MLEICLKCVLELCLKHEWNVSHTSELRKQNLSEVYLECSECFSLINCPGLILLCVYWHCSSTTVGLTKVKKDKFSIFNFLTVATPSAEQPPPQAAPDKNKERVGSLDRENPLDEKGSRWDKRSSLLANVGVSEGGDVSINPKASKGSEEQSKTLSTLQVWITLKPCYINTYKQN